MEKAVVVVNRSTLVSQDNAIKAVAAVQRQINEHFMPAWGIGMALGVLGEGDPVPENHWLHFLYDDSAQAGALGFHEVTAQGFPVAYTFVRTTLDAGLYWQPTFSHEVLELLADPFCFSLVYNPYAKQFEWLEVGDPVERFEYDIDGVPVSDFVLPTWYGSAGNPPYSFLRKPDGPFELTRGGYKGIVHPNGTVTQEVARRNPHAAEPREIPAVGSRRWRRIARHGLPYGYQQI